ncbi:hypothetical protein JT359_09440 [Candidatus Poribacteria bacterium]|nr:hypothetical protein [Candidatus Poribacteria bacterium]
MKINGLGLVQLLTIVCILSVACVPIVFADAHEAGEMEEMEESSISGWFRTDTDALGTQIWVGASHPMGSISIDSDIYVVDTFGEFDIGLGIPVSDSDSLSLSLLPMVGIGFDYATANGPTTLIAPQLFTYLTAGSIYFESWIQGFFNSPFDEEGADSLYTRDFVTYSISDTVAIGPQVEATIDLGDDGGLGSLVFGGRLNLGYGENNTLGLFVGLETQLDDSEDTGLTGRMTFVRTW